MAGTSKAEREAIRAVAFVEATKGVAVLLAATGLLTLIHRNLHAIAAALVAHLHLNPAAKYPEIFLNLAAKLDEPHLLMLAAGATLYSLLRFVEAYGLFFERAWAELLAAVSGGVYVPFEVIELVRAPTWYGAALLAMNLAIVGLMVHALVRRRAREASDAP